ncbi:MAG: 1-(5-phosphoribosyl)-5-[(5-phosphoribosylamino)methylideneamino]imidazole-4-carboxamide isomerase [Dehalococcoidia bacterium]
MDLLPAIDIRGGRCVRLVQGDYERETVFDDDPAEAARRWWKAGASRLHVADLDGAREGRPVNTEAVERIVGAVDIPVQLGGGLRSLESVRRHLGAGVERAVIGTAAVENEPLLRELLARFPGRIVGGVDARDGVVVTEGWTDVSGIAAPQFVRGLAEAGVPRIVYTDTLRDGTLTAPNYAAIEDILALGLDLKVIYAGGISSVEQLRRLATTGVEAAIIGRALYTGDIDLEQALAEMAKIA